MGFLYFAINAHRCTHILQLFSKILHQLKLLALHIGLFKPSLDTDAAIERPTSYVFLTEGPCPSIVTVPANDLLAMIKKTLPIIEYGEFLEKLNVKSEEEEAENGACAICLSRMERWETMRELSNCCHVFHRECLDTWMDEFQISCPICRSMLLPNKERDGIRYVQ